MKVLQNVDTADVAVALKNAPAEDLEKVLSSMSSRAKTRFQEEFDMLTKVKIKDIEASQRKMLEAAQKLIDEGAIDRGMDE